jgi:hypothetical protein
MKNDCLVQNADREESKIVEIVEHNTIASLREASAIERPSHQILNKNKKYPKHSQTVQQFFGKIFPISISLVYLFR